MSGFEPGVVRREDRVWFLEHPGRRFHIREPFAGEFEREFRLLGEHQASRRRLLLHSTWPPGKRLRDDDHFGVLKVPFLLFADEGVEDDERVVGELFEDVMVQARIGMGGGPVVI